MNDERAFYLGPPSDAAFALAHLPSVERHPTGVVFCPPFGWDDVCSYRGRRAWARALVAAGHLALRLDLPGTGDGAGSAVDPARVRAWTDAVSHGGQWLRQEGCTRVCAIGIGLGGVLALEAAIGGGPIDDFVLWATPARGRSLVRELKAFARLQGQTAEDPGDTGLFAFGFAMSPETVAGLAGIDFGTRTLPDARTRRILLLGRDSLAPDPYLRAWLERSRTELSIAEGEGYAAMMEDPRIARSPDAVIARSIEWLAASVPEPRAAAAPAETALAHPRLELPGVRETPLSLTLAGRRVFGILCEPRGRRSRALCAVFTNAGGIRRIGPNRMWVEAARRWAQRGIPSLRLDLRGLGDADGDEGVYVRERAFYDDELLEQTLLSLDRLQALGLPPRFLLTGLCSGAYLSFRAAVADERVVAALPINLWAFHMSDHLVDERDIARARRLIRRRESVEASAARIALGVLRTIPRGAGRRSRRREAITLLDGLAARGVELLLQFSSDEPLLADLERDGLTGELGRWPNLRVERIPGEDHTFRTRALQRHVHAELDLALGRLLSRGRQLGPAEARGGGIGVRVMSPNAPPA